MSALVQQARGCHLGATCVWQRLTWDNTGPPVPNVLSCEDTLTGVFEYSVWWHFHDCFHRFPFGLFVSSASAPSLCLFSFPNKKRCVCFTPLFTHLRIFFKIVDEAKARAQPNFFYRLPRIPSNSVLCLGKQWLPRSRRLQVVWASPWVLILKSPLLWESPLCTRKGRGLQAPGSVCACCTVYGQISPTFIPSPSSTLCL